MMGGGGVCAVLDYEVDQMTDYVAEMAQRVVHPHSPAVTPAFRKFVSGILTATRLPSTTILLGLNYLSTRIYKLRNDMMNPFKPSDALVWRMVTIGLLLGSKFLDDNTFQNRSWAEVTGIQVAELNKLEQEWVEHINYNLYVNLDTSEGFLAWMDNWRLYRQTKNFQRKATLDRLAPLHAPLLPIDTNIPPASLFRPLYDRGLARTPSYHTNYTYDQNVGQSAWSNNSYGYPTPQLTPPSAHDSGFNTPEYPSATGGNPRWNDWSVYNGHPNEYVYSKQYLKQQQMATYFSSHTSTPAWTPYGNTPPHRSEDYITYHEPLPAEWIQSICAEAKCTIKHLHFQNQHFTNNAELSPWEQTHVGHRVLAY